MVASGILLPIQPLTVSVVNAGMMEVNAYVFNVLIMNNPVYFSIFLPSLQTQNLIQFCGFSP